MDNLTAINNFNAVHNYMMWKFPHLLITTWSNQKAGSLQISLYFNPDLIPKKFLWSELRPMIDADAKVEFHPIKGHNDCTLTIEWRW